MFVLRLRPVKGTKDYAAQSVRRCAAPVPQSRSEPENLHQSLSVISPVPEVPRWATVRFDLLKDLRSKIHD